jgi:hypothetical protein
MRAWLAGLSFLVIAGLLTLPRSQGQTSPQPSPPAVPAPDLKTPAGAVTIPAQTSPRDLSKRSPLQRQLELSAQRGADWLFRHNRPDGRFIHGFIPALQLVLDGDHYLRQVGAVGALAQAARFSGFERYSARARQAMLTLLLDTAPDSQDPRVRHTSWPSVVVNRLGAAGLLVWAINELPAPGDDLLEESEQLCAFIAKQQRPDGSLNYSDDANAQVRTQDPDGINHYTGQALYGLMRSQQYRPAPWKTEVIRKALAFYRPSWKTHPSAGMVSGHVAAYAEALAVTKEKVFADCVFEMTDWLCELQYVRFDAQHPLWTGGFMTYENGKPAQTEPDISSASYAEALAEGVRTARQLGDLQRYQKYTGALKSCLQFITSLQYTEANTTHFADWYRQHLLGGFHSSHQDGTLRIDYNQHAVSALIQAMLFMTD